MRGRMDWRAKRILPANFPPHGQPSFPEPLTINDLQKQGWIWVPWEAPKSGAYFYNLLIIKVSANKILAVGWKTRPAPETGTGGTWKTGGGVRWMGRKCEVGGKARDVPRRGVENKSGSGGGKDGSERDGTDMKKRRPLAYEPERARCRWDLLIKDGGGLLSRPYGQYHRRWRA